MGVERRQACDLSGLPLLEPLLLFLFYSSPSHYSKRKFKECRLREVGGRDVRRWSLLILLSLDTAVFEISCRTTPATCKGDDYILSLLPWSLSSANTFRLSRKSNIIVFNFAEL